MEVEDVRAYVAAKAESERDKIIVSNEISHFAENIKNGLGEEIKKEIPSKKDNKFIEFLKRLFNTCQ